MKKKSSRFFSILIVLIAVLACFTMTSCDNSLKTDNNNNQSQNDGSGNDAAKPNEGGSDSNKIEELIPGADKIPGINTPKNDAIAAPKADDIVVTEDLFMQFISGTKTDVLYAKMTDAQYLEFVKSIKLIDSNVDAKIFPDEGVLVIQEIIGNEKQQMIQRGDGTWVVIVSSPIYHFVTDFGNTEITEIENPNLTNKPSSKITNKADKYILDITWEIPLTEEEKQNDKLIENYYNTLISKGYKIVDGNICHGPNITSACVDKNGNKIILSKDSTATVATLEYKPAYEIAADDYSGVTFMYMTDMSMISSGKTTPVNYTKMNDSQMANLKSELLKLKYYDAKDSVELEMKDGSFYVRIADYCAYDETTGNTEYTNLVQNAEGLWSYIPQKQPEN